MATNYEDELIKHNNQLIKEIHPNELNMILESYKNYKSKEKEINGVIFHKGKPPGLHECSKCLVMKTNENFKYYNQRVDKSGYLMRSNALCLDCDKVMSVERKTTLDKATKNNEIKDKPLPGDICEKCNRKWGSKEQPRNWHRDHDAIQNKFRGWLCGDCNMAKHDHRHNIS